MKKLRKEKLDEIKNINKTIILYEAPHKILNTINDLENILENRFIFIVKYSLSVKWSCIFLFAEQKI